jgi:alkylhydroperoxidase family enzyme
MLLRASGAMTGTAVDLGAVNGGRADDGGVSHGAELIAFTEAVMRGDEATIARERQRLRAVLDPEAFVDVAAVIGSFNVVDRIADATGIPLDETLGAATEDVRRELGLARFASAANTPGGSSG